MQHLGMSANREVAERFPRLSRSAQKRTGCHASDVGAPPIHGDGIVAVCQVHHAVLGLSGRVGTEGSLLRDSGDCSQLLTSSTPIRRGAVIPYDCRDHSDDLLQTFN